MTAKNLTIKLFADGADLDAMTKHRRQGTIQGFTTNPTLMRQVGLTDYEAFARAALAAIPDLPISFEVFSDDFGEMESQARRIAGWGDNVYVKIPITNTKGEPADDLIRTLSGDGIRLNVTAMLLVSQVEAVMAALTAGVEHIASVFAGRIADTGVDPVPMMQECRDVLRENPKVELLWASSREVLNIFQAQDAGCHIITVTDPLLAKLSKVGMDLGALSLDTVKMFYDDAGAAGYRI